MLKILAFTVPLLLTTNAFSDMQEAKEMFDEANCVQCHSVNKFKYRKDKISNFDKLHSMVTSCATASAAPWFDDEIKDVSLYLNKEYYKFKVEEK
ncbi:MAG: mono/diheme cytochrome c family protein [Sulfurimonas sp.]|jgi:mono/diheme cytochrome c family protein|uniref:hypothetical protein n=1 Tax=Sulfurimonas sp. TaxID=2022749 RepID=UPI0039E44149